MGKGQGYHQKTRRLHRKNVRHRGLRGLLAKYLVDYEVGMKVDIIGDPAIQKRGFPHRRFHGKTGTIVELRGRCFGVDVKDGNKILKNTRESDLKSIAREEGMVTLREDGINKVIEGLTSLEEVLRVTVGDE